MSIKKIYHKIKKENNKNAQFSLNPLVEYIFRYFGFYLSAVLIKLKIHPTSVNLTNLCLGVVATFLIYLSVDNLNVMKIKNLSSKKSFEVLLKFEKQFIKRKKKLI